MKKIVTLLFLVIALKTTECKNLQSRIVDGEEVEPHSIPYQVSIQNINGFVFCGGSVVREDAILTAATCCINHPSGDELVVVAGEHNLAEEDGFEQVREVSQVIMHEAYDFPTNDICLLILKSPLDFSDGTVAAVQLPNKGDDYVEGDLVAVSGWGNVGIQGGPSDVLLRAEVPIFNHQKCKERYTFSFEVTDGMVCAGGAKKDFCNGDTGGPLVCDGVHCGIASEHTLCGLTLFPSVYTKTSFYIDWIQSKLPKA